MAHAIDLTGKQFGRLTVLSRDFSKTGYVYWICKCVCGAKKSIAASHLRSGATRSCGCLHYDWLAENNPKHNGSYERLYGVWSMMRQRCENPNNKDYPHYGGRGIIVCSAWNDYGTFRTWANTAGYKRGLSIDRIDFNGPYAPENCQWVTQEKQKINTRKNRYIDTPAGKLAMSEVSRRYHIPYDVLKWRVNNGWAGEKLLQYRT